MNSVSACVVTPFASGYTAASDKILPSTSRLTGDFGPAVIFREYTETTFSMTTIRTMPRSGVTQQPHYLRNTRMPTLMFKSNADVDKYVALVVEGLIRENNSTGMPTVLGLPTGSTPIGIYRELIRLHQNEGLDFSQVITFNLDEYWPMPPDSIHSYNRWMRANFFDHVNIAEENIHIPRGDLAAEEIDGFCEQYEREIERVGGIQLQLLGIGRTGHIGFNEPGSSRNSRTRLVTLDPQTRRDAAASFYGEDNVPLQAVTMGVGTIMAARRIIIVALGEHKAPIVRLTVEGEISDEIPATYLQKHPQSVFVVDESAGAHLTAVDTPWVVGRCEWTPMLEKRAVVWLSRKVGKPLPRLSSRDFHDHHLYDLVRTAGGVEPLRRRVFESLLNGICPRPGVGEKCTALIFSPHPDDDVISMGGTLITLVEQGHDVHVAYQTSGNIAVFDHAAMRHIDFVAQLARMFGFDADKWEAMRDRIRTAVASKKPGEPDLDEMLDIKALIRATEAVAATAIAGVPRKNLHFLDLPFYQTGKVEKAPISDADVKITADLLLKLKPDQVYVAGDLSDPHGTHRMCAQAITRALKQVELQGLKPEVWLYRGAWQEYEPHEIDRAVPLSPETTERKKHCIFRHESQKDAAMFPGNDEREFWMRAEDRTKATAAIYNQLGLPEYYAIEAFVRYNGQL
jgi:glucosamine-6-phosphate deaminase